MCFALFVTPAVHQKIEEVHQVSVLEAEEAFFLFNGTPMEDRREKHRTKPPTYWLLSYTSDGRLLKLVVIFDEEKQIAWLRTAYEPSQEEIDFYETNT
jgi:hypothetical protein